MKTKTLIAGAVALSLLGGSAALAQPYGGHDNRQDHGNGNAHGQKHAEKAHKQERKAYRKWQRGQRLPANYRGQAVDYRRHHLRAPPRGYQWRQVDNTYVLAALTTGLIAEVLNIR